jgi:hypothetical protein
LNRRRPGFIARGRSLPGSTMKGPTYRVCSCASGQFLKIVGIRHQSLCRFRSNLRCVWPGTIVQAGQISAAGSRSPPTCGAWCCCSGSAQRSASTSQGLSAPESRNVPSPRPPPTCVAQLYALDEQAGAAQLAGMPWQKSVVLELWHWLVCREVKQSGRGSSRCRTCRRSGFAAAGHPKSIAMRRCYRQQGG